MGMDSTEILAPIKNAVLTRVKYYTSNDWMDYSADYISGMASWVTMQQNLGYSDVKYISDWVTADYDPYKGFRLYAAGFMKAPSAATAITSDPTNADVYVNNVKIGATPYTSTTLKQGDDVRLKKTGFIDNGVSIFRVPEKIHLILQPVVIPPEVPWYKKWFGWTKEQIQNLIFLNPVADILAIAKVLDNLLPEEWTQRKVAMPDWVYEMGLWIYFAPAMATGVSGLVKAGATKAKAEGVFGALKDGMKFDELMLMIRQEPAKYSKLMTLMTTEEKSIIMAALKKQADPTAYRLAAEALEVAAKSEGLTAIQKVLGVLPGATTGKKLFIAFSSLVGAASAYIGTALFLAWTGKEAIKEAISFSGLYLFIDNKEWQAAKDNLPALKTAIEAYDKATALTKVIPFINDIWAEAIRNAWIEYHNYEKLIDEELAKLPTAVGILKVSPTPADAKVSVDKLPFVNSAFQQEVEVGIYHVLVTKWGYVSQDKYMEVLDKASTFWEPVLVKEVTPPLEKAKLTISVTPDGSTISVSNHPEITAEGDYFLDEGTYTIKITLAGYKTDTTSVYLKAGEPYVHSRILEEEIKYGTLVLSFSPAEAVINVSNHPEITTSGSYKLQTGNYTIDFTLEGYKPERRTLYLDKDEIETISVTLSEIPLPPPEKGTLKLAVTPFDAVIEVPGFPEINMPGTYVLDPGTYEIVASKEGYDQSTATAYIRKDVVTNISLSLVKSPPGPEEQAEITIKSEPTNSEVYIDGEYTFMKTPATKLFDPGTYLIRVQTPGYYPYEIQIEVAAGEVGEITIPLTKIPDIDIPKTPYKPWTYYLPDYPVPPVGPVTPSPYPYPGLPGADYSALDPASIFYSTPVDVTAPYTRELILNIETTDVLPFAGKITSIAWIDLSSQEQEAMVITSDDEEDLIRTFLDFFDSKGFTRIVGYNVSFDHRFIFTKAALYRRQCKLWADVQTRDVMQILQQVKEAYVFGFNKPGTLDQWGKHLLGYGKYGSQEECLARFIRKDFEYVDAFNINQVDLVYDLYALLRFTLSEATITQITAIPEAISSSPVIPSVESYALPTTKKCLNCLQANPIENKDCFVCGAAL